VGEEPGIVAHDRDVLRVADRLPAVRARRGVVGLLLFDELGDVARIEILEVHGE
jgi:hypothetical protein